MTVEAQWEPITIASEPVVGDPDRATGRVPIVFPLSAKPPPEWTEYFEQASENRLARRGGPRPHGADLRIQTDGIRVLSRVSEEDAYSWIKAVKQQVDDANTWYANHVLTEQERQEAERQRADEAADRTKEEMRRWVSEAWRRQPD